MWQVYRKELVELLRDKKTLFFIIALPIIVFPVIFGLVGFFASQAVMQEQQKVLKYAIVNESAAPKFSEAIFYHRDFERVDITFKSEEERVQAVRDEKVDLIIVLNDNFQSNFELAKQSTWQLYFNNASTINMVKNKVKKVFNDFEKNIQKEFFAQQGVSVKLFEAIMAPVILETVNTADERENVGEVIGGFIPYILIPLLLTGAMYPAIDIGAGEKERGTLETLLLTPISRFAIVMGKFLTILTTGLMTALITVSSLLFWGHIVGSVLKVNAVARMFETFGVADMVIVLVLLLPLAAFFAAILLAISIYAKSYKEAQNYMGPMTMVGIIPVMFAMLPGIELTGKWALVPITNVALAIKEILKGTIEYSMLFAIFGSTLVFAIAAIWFCVHWFNKEAVLFR